MEPDGRQLLAALAGLNLPAGQLDHRRHVHAAWQCLREQPLPAAAQRLAGLLQAYVRHLNAEDKYHHTLTLAFMHIINERMQASPADDFQAFAATNPDLFVDARSLIIRYYSPEQLMSADARNGFVEPDRAALP